MSEQQNQIDNILVVIGEEIPGRFAVIEQDRIDHAARLAALEVAVGALADAVREIRNRMIEEGLK